MNKMNLPPPFEELEEEFPMLREIYNIEKYRDIFGSEITSKGKKYWLNVNYTVWLLNVQKKKNRQQQFLLL